MKPIVFLSHSSSDKEVVLGIKNLLASSSGGHVDYFLSTDGQSIRAGTNWVVSIEDALRRAEIVFAFISPKSARSSWVVFECGVAYGKDLRVVPVGIDGLEIGELGFPISLLQGFTLKDSEGILNIIRLINDRLNLAIPLVINPEEYRSLVGNRLGTKPGSVAANAAFVDAIFVHYTLLPFQDADQMLLSIESVLREDGYTVEANAGKLIGPGFEIEIANAKLKAKLGPSTLCDNMAMLLALGKKVTGETSEIDVTLNLNPSVSTLHDPVLVSDRLAAEGISRRVDNQFQFEKGMFQIHGAIRFPGKSVIGPRVLARYPLRLLQASSIDELLATLLRRGILRVEGGYPR